MMAREGKSGARPGKRTALRRHQHVSLARHGAQHAPLLVADGPANIGDALGEGILSDGDVVPDLGDEVVFGDEAAGVFGEETQYGQGARAQLHMLPLRGPQFVRDEVNDILRQLHLPLEPCSGARHGRASPSQGLGPFWSFFVMVQRAS